MKTINDQDVSWDNLDSILQVLLYQKKVRESYVVAYLYMVTLNMNGNRGKCKRKMESVARLHGLEDCL